VAGGKRRLAAIVAADVAAYSRLVSEDEDGTLEGLRAHRDDLIDPLIEDHDGRIANTAGDSLLIEFASAIEAVRCAIAIQHGMAGRNIAVPRDRQIRFRIGINVGDVLERDGDLLGEGVNVAARLESLAEPGEIYISLAARDQVRDRLSLDLEDLGEIRVKNIPRPVHVFRLLGRAGDDAAAVPPAGRRRFGPVPMLALMLLVFVLGAASAVLVLRPQLTDRMASETAAVAEVELAPRPTTKTPQVFSSAATSAAPLRPAAAPDTSEAATPAQVARLTPVPASPAADATGQFDGLWTGAAFCDYGTSFETSKFTFRVDVRGGQAALELLGTGLQDGGRDRFRWTTALDPQGRSDAATTLIAGRRVPVTLDLSSAPAAGRVDFDGCVVDLALANAAAPVVQAFAAPPEEGRWSAYFDDCGTSFGGVPLVYSLALQVRDGAFRAELDVANTYETVRATMSGPVERDGRLEARFETSLKTSETQTLRADLSGTRDAPWVAIDDCRRALVPVR